MCMLHVSEAHDDGGWQNLLFVHHKCLSQQLSCWTTVVYIEMGPHSKMNLCTHFNGFNIEVPWQISIPDRKAMCCAGVSKLCSVSSSLPPIRKKLQGDKPAKSRFRTATSRPSQTSTAARVRAAYTWVSLLAIYSFTSSSISAYRAFSANSLLPFHCLYPALMIGLHSLHVSFVRNSSLTSDV